MATASLPLIDVDRLQLGMYIVLDVGWRNHPFLRSSFTITTPEQLQQIRELGPRQVQYCPERSTAHPLPETLKPADTQAARGARNPDIVQVRSWADIEQPGEPILRPRAASAAVAQATTVSASDPPTPGQWQEQQLRHAEREYTQVQQRHQQLLKQLMVEPLEARHVAEQLGETLYHAVADCDIPAVRLLSQRVGPQNSAHEVSVAALAVLLAQDCGFSADAVKQLAIAALLHDIGKLRIPAFLHEDNGKLTEFERISYRQHVEFGVQLAKSLQLPISVIRAIAEHHEHQDGSGFPAALSGTKMAAASRVLAIVNRYCNLVCPLRVESGLTPHQAMKQMYGVERAHFDASFLQRFVRLLGIYPPGSLVELTDQRMAIVIASRPGASLAPRVQIIERPDDVEFGAAIDIGSDDELRVRHSLPPEKLNPRWAQRARLLARTPTYIEPQSAPEWGPWGTTAVEQTMVF